MCAEGDRGTMAPCWCTGHLVVGIVIFLNSGIMEEELDQRYLHLSIFLTPCKSGSIRFLGPNPFTCNEASFTPTLNLPPLSLYALVINWVSSLYQYCLTFFSFFLSGLSCSLSFLLYATPFFSPFHSPLPLLGCSQLVLETYNVPELSAGVNCTFEDLSEMDGLVVGNQIQCYSPAAKEVPRIITENGERSPEAGLGGMASPCLAENSGQTWQGAGGRGLREPSTREGQRKGCGLVVMLQEERDEMPFTALGIDY